MKKLIGYFFLTLSIALPAAERAAALSAVFGGGPIYLQRDYSLEELRNSGFTTLIVWTIHIEANGDLGFNGEFPLVRDGVYIGHQTHPEFADDIAYLKSAPSSISRIEFGLSAWGSGTYDAVKALIEAEGTGPGTTLYENFKALKEAIPEIDALNNDDESTYDVPSSVAFSIMLYDLGFKTTLVPYTRAASYWQPLTEQVNAARPGAIDALYLQAYAGGSGNSPCSPSWNFGLPVYPGLWSRDYSPAGIESRMQSWKDECGIEGGFMWLYDDFDNSSQVAEYAAAINNAVGGSDDGGGDQEPQECFEPPLSLSITFDRYPEETRWSLLREGAVVASGDGYGDQPDLSTLVIPIDIGEGDYTFTFQDSYGDGICCGYGEGSFSLTDNQGLEIHSGGAFGYSSTKAFCSSL